MAGNDGVGRRGRPLGFVSQKVLEKIAVDRQATSAQLSTALQLNRRHATMVCAELASAGHLQVVSREGRFNVYSLPDDESREPGWMMIVQALKP